MADLYTSRFIETSDATSNPFVFQMPQTWWSRPYEYEWAGSFVESGDVVLDAACGIGHPFKFFLAEKADQVFACDLDPRIESREEIAKDVEATFGLDAIQKLAELPVEKIQYAKANLTELPYEEKVFDKIFCISVMEHLKSEDIRLALADFKRVLKDDGLIVLTFDFPLINLQAFKEVLRETGLMFYAEHLFDKPTTAITSNLWGELYCFRAVLKKESPSASAQKASFDYKRFWEENYERGGNSGSGSYGVLAAFKAEIINEFIAQNKVQTVMEYGCGDGNQLSYMNYPAYLGLDIAYSSIEQCIRKFKDDHSKSFQVYRPSHFVNHAFFTAELVVCLDVLYHIIDEDDFQKTLDDIFTSATKYVILYTKVTEDNPVSSVLTIRDRNIMEYLKRYQDFRVSHKIEQRYPRLSSASFIILEKIKGL
jgi:ubiquinone/menaquinone biosynthesis C-methylase UbiE